VQRLCRRIPSFPFFLCDRHGCYYPFPLFRYGGSGLRTPFVSAWSVAALGVSLPFFPMDDPSLRFAPLMGRSGHCFAFSFSSLGTASTRALASVVDLALRSSFSRSQPLTRGSKLSRFARTLPGLFRPDALPFIERAARRCCAVLLERNPRR